MTILYHGTSVVYTRSIAEAGFLFSRFEQEKYLLRENRTDLSVEEIERRARAVVGKSFGPHEAFERVYCISTHTQFDLAKSYALQYENSAKKGGILFELEMEVEPTWKRSDSGVIFVPKPISLEQVTCIYFTPQAWDEENFEMVAQAFEQYGADYFPI